MTRDEDRPDDWFDDVTLRTGIRFTYRNGRESERFYLIEGFGGGLAMIDYDLDGDMDLFACSGGQMTAEPAPPQISGLPSCLYRNDGNWRFVEISGIAGFVESPDYSLGCNITDYDGDGFPDLFVTCYGRSRLYPNRGDGTFAEAVDEQALPALGMCTAAAWGDIDRDGLPDLFLARYADWSPERDVKCFAKSGKRDMCGPLRYDGTVGLFFHNRGDGTFDDWSERVGLKGDSRGLGVVAGDFDDDGWIDFYLVNDETPEHLYWGSSDLRLIEGAGQAGVAVGELGTVAGSMGVDVGDVDGDGRPDLWVVNFANEDNSLYLNRGERSFQHATIATGLASTTRARVAWGTSLTDFDGDGWLDILVLNGDAIYFSSDVPYKQLPHLFRNLEGKKFENISERGGTYFREPHAGRGDAVGDLDGDGAPDVVASHINDPVRVLRNRMTPENFVSVALRARQGALEAVGARVTCRPDGESGRELARFVVNGGGYLSHSDDRILFPVAPDAITAEVTVHWPGRGTETFRNLAVRRTHVLIEGRGEADEPR